MSRYSPPSQRLTEVEDRLKKIEAGGGRHQIVTALLGVLGAGVGLLGIVTLFGGIAIIGEYRGVKIPGTEAVADVSRSQLLATGADRLVPIAFGVTVTLAALVLLQAYFERKPGRIVKWWRERKPGRIVKWWRERKIVKAWRRWRPAVAERSPAQRATIIVGWLLFLIGIGLYVSRSDLFEATPVGKGVARIGAVVVVALLALGAVLARVATREHGTPVAAVVLSGTIVLYGAAEAYLAHRANPKLRGAAVLRDDGSGLRGFWIAENNGRDYLGEVDPKLLHSAKGSSSFTAGRIIAIPASSVTAVAIGEYQTVSKANNQAHCLLTELERRFSPAARKKC